ncbi:MAG: RDD family protein [Planctomycetota bacterium]
MISFDSGDTTYMQRLFSLCLDFVIIFIVFLLIIIISVVTTGTEDLFFPVFLVFISGAYYLWHWSLLKSGQTIGMRLMKIKIIPAQQTISYWVPIYRFFASVTPLLIFIAPLKTSILEPSILDKMSGTYTIKVTPQNKTE